MNEFFLGGRDVGPWLSAFAYGTTYFSAVLFVGYAGKIGFGFGLSALWIAAGNALVGSLLAWLRAGQAHAAHDGPSRRDDDAGVLGRSATVHRWLKIASALIIFIFLVPYSASVYTGLAYLFEQIFGLDFAVALWGMAVLTGVYLVLGGYLAVARNDLIQGIVMVVGVIFMVGYVLRRARGRRLRGRDRQAARGDSRRLDRRVAAVEPLAVQLGGLPAVARRGARLPGDPHQPRRLGPAADGAQVLRDPRHRRGTPGDRHLDAVRGAHGRRRLLHRRPEPPLPGGRRAAPPASSSTPSCRRCSPRRCPRRSWR